MYLCLCRGVREADVEQAGRRGLLTPDALISAFGLDDEACCGCCIDRIEEFVVLAQSAAHQAMIPACATTEGGAARRPSPE